MQGAEALWMVVGRYGYDNVICKWAWKEPQVSQTLTILADWSCWVSGRNISWYFPLASFLVYSQTPPDTEL